MSCPATHVPSSYDPNTAPSVRIFEHGDCTGQSRVIAADPQGRQVGYNLHNAPLYFGDAISSMVVPPNTKVVLYHHTLFSNDNPRRTFGPGVYRNFDREGIRDDSGRFGMNDQATFMEVTPHASKSHAEFLRDCCQGIEPAEICANYAGPMQPACQPSMQYHCGLSLDWFRKPICKQWCNGNKEACDEIAKRLCTGNGDSFCACFNADPNIIRPSCFDPKCSSGTAYQTIDQKNSATNCGVYCNQQFNIDKVTRDALVNDNTFNQQCSSTVQAYKNELAAAPTPTSLASSPVPVGNKSSFFPSQSTDTGSNTTLIAGGLGVTASGGLLVCCGILIVLAIVMYLRSRKK